MKRSTEREINRRSFSNFGFSTILTALVMIALMTFSTLALMTANSDYRLSRKVADRTASYYEAEELAYTHLARIDECLEAAYAASSYEEEYYSAAAASLLEYGRLHPELSLTVDEKQEQYRISYQIAVTDTQTLIVGLSISDPAVSGGAYYTLTCWRTAVSIPAGSQDQPLHLLGS